MTIKLRSIVHAISSLSKVSAGDLSLHLAYRLKKMMNALQKEADFFSRGTTKPGPSTTWMICSIWRSRPMWK